MFSAGEGEGRRELEVEPRLVPAVAPSRMCARGWQHPCACDARSRAMPLRSARRHPMVAPSRPPRDHAQGRCATAVPRAATLV
jgi:hypothetical protein